ncbi:MAG TPA: right-handed parallel beta-helix repeat-containing protein [Terriglobales bacterium]|nr:right-handed parallel beta-helix repeat-containing protein [Terriglobales bacterium]
MRLSSNTTMLLKLIVIAAAALAQAGSTWANAVTPRDFGGKGDVVTLRDGAITAATPSFHSGSAAFTAADVGKAIVVTGAAERGVALVTKIKGFVSPKELTLEANASATVRDALTYYGTDDTKAIRSCVFEGTAKGGECIINDGVTFMVSNTTSIMSPFQAGHNPIPKGTIGGYGRIIFAPQEPFTAATNDRLFYISSQETRPMQIAGAIAIGATSFRAQDPSDAATLTMGDWLLVTERDPTVKDHVYADWMQVAGVEGTVIQTKKPFRTQFPNVRSWSGPPAYWGLSFRKVGPLTSNITIRDLTIIVPKRTRGPGAISTRDSMRTVISNVRCQNASGSCFFGYMDQGMIFRHNNINGALYPEFAAAVDAEISGNHFNEQGTALSLPGPPTAGGLEVDFGTAFTSITDNVIGPSHQVCIMLWPAVHDTIVKGNTCGVVTFGTGAACILARGGYRITATENTCMGGTGASRGIDFMDALIPNTPIYSNSNKIFNNRVQGFATPYACEGGRLRTDACDHRK